MIITNICVDKFDMHFIGWQEQQLGKIDNFICWKYLKMLNLEVPSNKIWCLFYTLKYMYGTYIIINY